MSNRRSMFACLLSISLSLILTIAVLSFSTPAKSKEHYQLNNEFIIKLNNRDYFVYKVTDGWLLLSRWDLTTTFVPDKKHVWEMRLSGQKTLEKRKK